ncbi:phasin family protein [Legionella sp. CNM-4043-24]|uniref:phasin family protein n=1 Tax=Legionella sp. CNM-4043-24 TaxID=3421646 RepID=UPI00403AFBDD
MNQEYFEKWSDLAKKAQEHFQAIAKLNVETLQGLAIKPEELANLKKPEELLEKQVNLAVENGHKALGYMQKSFEIFEKSMQSLLKEVKNKAGDKK